MNIEAKRKRLISEAKKIKDEFNKAEELRIKYTKQCPDTAIENIFRQMNTQ